MRILFIGDIFGRPGRRLLADHLADVVQNKQIDLVLANGENAAAGFGITPSLADDLFKLGIEVITTGNHVWDKKEILPYFQSQPRLLRAANFPSAPGRGVFCGQTRGGVPFAVLHLMGRVFMLPLDCPFRTADAELARLPGECRIRVVDFHAEATSEKQAFGWHLDGKVTAVIGTHTHVPTADERVLPGGTAFITDVGMTGPYESVIGVDRRIAVKKFLDQMPARFEPAEGDVRLASVIVDADEQTGRARSIERYMLAIV
ncbi:MAG: TIGR00282 family metallophosphoesterase [Dongiaceae bacterium]